MIVFPQNGRWEFTAGKVWQGYPAPDWLVRIRELVKEIEEIRQCASCP